MILASCNYSKKPKKLPKTKQYEKLIGKWKVTKSSFLPFEHPSFCEKIGIKSVFDFDEDGILKVYENQTTTQNCNEYQVFWIDANELIVFEYDVHFPYQILKLTHDSLVLKTTNVPDYLLINEPVNPEIDTKNDTIDYIVNNGIVITLIK